jgi:hypothetical protein
MTTVKIVSPVTDDPLGYEGDVLARVRAMAQDAITGVNEDAVEEEAAVLRNRLGLTHRMSRNAADQRR